MHMGLGGCVGVVARRSSTALDGEAHAQQQAREEARGQQRQRRATHAEHPPHHGGGFGREHVRLALEQLGLHVQRQLAPRGAPQRILDDLVLLRRQRCNEAAPARGQ
jgi:hypothetical protein